MYNKTKQSNTETMDPPEGMIYFQELPHLFKSTNFIIYLLYMLCMCVCVCIKTKWMLLLKGIKATSKNMESDV